MAELKQDNDLVSGIEDDAATARLKALEAAIGSTQEPVSVNAPVEGTQGAVNPNEPVDPADPLGVRIYNDVAAGIKQTPAMLYSGFRGFMSEVGESLDDLGKMLNENPQMKKAGERMASLRKEAGVSEGPEFTAEGAAEELPAAEKPQSVTAGFVKSTEQFLLGFIPFIKGIKALNGGIKVAKGVQYAENVLASGIAMATVFDPMEERLSNFLKDLDATPEFLAPVLEYLAADKSDTKAEGRFKAFLEGTGVGVVGDTLIAGLRSLKYLRLSKGDFNGVKVNDLPGYSPAVQVTRTIPTIEMAVNQEYQKLASTLVRQSDGTFLNSKGDVFSEQDLMAKARKTAEQQFSALPQAPAEAGGLAQIVNVPRIVTKDGKTYYGNQSDLVTHADIIAANQLTDKALEGATLDQGSLYLVPKNKGMKEIFIKEEQANLQPGDTSVKGFIDSKGKFYTPGEAYDAAKRASLSDVKGFKFAGSKGRGIISTEAEQAFVQGKGGIKALLKDMNMAPIDNVQKLEKLVLTVADRVKVSRNAPKAVDVKDVTALASRLGVDPMDLANRNPILMNNPSAFYASVEVMNAMAETLAKQAKAITENTATGANVAMLSAFSRDVATYKAFQSFLRTGKMDQAESLLKTHPTLTGGADQEINALTQHVIMSGGAGAVRRLARAINESGGTGNFEKALKVSNWRKVNEVLEHMWFFNLLSSVSTQTTNIASNAIHLIMQPPIRALAARISTSPEGVVKGEAAEMYYAMISGFKDAIRLAGKGYITGKTTAKVDKFENYHVGAISAENFGVKGPIGALIDATGLIYSQPSRLLLATDEFFRATARNMELRATAFRQAKSKGLQGPALSQEVERLLRNPDDLEQLHAEQFGRTATFTNDLGTVGNWAVLLQSRAGIVGKLFVPFIRTITNIFKEGVSMTPAAPFWPALRRDLMSKGAKGDIARAKFLVGLGVTAAVTGEAAAGNITAAGPREKATRNIWDVNHEPFSIRINEELFNIISQGGVWSPIKVVNKNGNYWMRYDNLGPLSIVIGMNAAVGESLWAIPTNDASEVMTQMAADISRATVSETFLPGVSNLFNLLNDPGGPEAQNWLTSTIASAAVPGIVKFFRNIEDPMSRETSGDAEIDWRAEAINKIYNAVPGHSDKLQPRRNGWGQVIWAPNISDEEAGFTIGDTSPISDWMYENGVGIDKPSKVQNDGVKLTAEEWDYVVRMAGNELKLVHGKGLHDLLNDIIEGKDSFSPLWKRLTDGPEGSRADFVKGLIADYREAAVGTLYRVSKEYRSKVKLRQQEKIHQLKIGPITPGGQ